MSSDKKVTDKLTPYSSELFASYKETPGLRTCHTYVCCQSITGKIGTDQTGRFFVPSVSGNNYLLIAADGWYDKSTCLISAYFTSDGLTFNVSVMSTQTWCFFV